MRKLLTILASFFVIFSITKDAYGQASTVQIDNYLTGEQLKVYPDGKLAEFCPNCDSDLGKIYTSLSNNNDEVSLITESYNRLAAINGDSRIITNTDVLQTILDFKNGLTINSWGILWAPENWPSEVEMYSFAYEKDGTLGLVQAYAHPKAKDGHDRMAFYAFGQPLAKGECGGQAFWWPNAETVEKLSYVKVACWDTDADGVADANEDRNGDGVCDNADCIETITKTEYIQGETEYVYMPIPTNVGQGYSQAGNYYYDNVQQGGFFQPVPQRNFNLNLGLAFGGNACGGCGNFCGNTCGWGVSAGFGIGGIGFGFGFGGNHQGCNTCPPPPCNNCGSSETTVINEITNITEVTVVNEVTEVVDPVDPPNEGWTPGGNPETPVDGGQGFNPGGNPTAGNPPNGGNTPGGNPETGNGGNTPGGNGKMLASNGKSYNSNTTQKVDLNKVTNTSVYNASTKKPSYNTTNNTAKKPSYNSDKVDLNTALKTPVSNNASYKTPNTTNYKTPNANTTYKAPANSSVSYKQPSTNYKAPNTNSYKQPSNTSYKAPANNTYKAPNNNLSSGQGYTAYKQPASNNVSYKQPTNTSYKQPSNNSYKTPSNVSYKAPSNTSYKAPNNTSFKGSGNASFKAPATNSKLSSFNYKK